MRKQMWASFVRTRRLRIWLVLDGLLLAACALTVADILPWAAFGVLCLLFAAGVAGQLVYDDRWLKRQVAEAEAQRRAQPPLS